MSDADRALAGRRHRAPGVPEPIAGEEDSLPIIVDSADEPTPPMGSRAPGRRRRRVTIQQWAEETKLEIREMRQRLDEREKLRADERLELTERIISLESRLDGLDRLGESTDELRQLRIDLTALGTQLFGVDGKNGKIGTLEHKASTSKRWALAAAGTILGSASGAVLYVYTLVREAADVRATFRTKIEAIDRDRAELHNQINVLFRLVGGRNRSAEPSMGAQQ